MSKKRMDILKLNKSRTTNSWSNPKTKWSESNTYKN